MSSFNDEMTFERLAAEKQAERHANATAPSHLIYAGILKCAADHMANGDVSGSETILNALMIAMNRARDHVAATPVTSNDIAEDIDEQTHCFRV